MKPLKSLAIAVSGLCALPAAANGKEIQSPEPSGMAMMRLNASLLSENIQNTAQKDNNSAQRIYGGSVWKQLTHDFRMDEVNSNLVRSHESKFSSNGAYFNRTLNRSKPYMFHITNEVKKRGMPAEIALLPFIESAYVTKARSHVGASGLWQFMPATGRHYGLEQTPLYDGRHDVYASTNAALNYLQYLHSLFGDWSLALAAYNWGEGNMARAIRRAQASGLPPTYENLRMPSETRNYVPKLLAVRNIVRNPQAYGVQLPDIQHSPYFKPVTVDTPMDIMAAAHLANISESEFLSLNPAFKTPVFIPKNGRKMLLPVTAVNTFETNYRNSDARSLLSWDVFTPDYTMTLNDIAAKTNTSVSELRRLNGINGKRVTAGKSILVSRNNSLNTPPQHITLNFAKADNDPVPDNYVEQALVLNTVQAPPPAPQTQNKVQKQVNFINFVENGAPPENTTHTAQTNVDNNLTEKTFNFRQNQPQTTHAAAKPQISPEHFAFADVTNAIPTPAPTSQLSNTTSINDPIMEAARNFAASQTAQNRTNENTTHTMDDRRNQALQATRVAVAEANREAAIQAAKEAAQAKAKAAAERAAKLAEAKRREQERLRTERLEQAQQLASIRKAREANQPMAQAIRASAQQHNGTHRVQAGDTLYNIAQRYNLNVADLITTNNIRNNHIRIGQVLRLSGSKKSSRASISKVAGHTSHKNGTPTSYTVRKGDTLHGIAARYNLNINDIKRLNHGTSNLKTGQTIKLTAS